MKKIILAIAMVISMFSIEAQVTETGSNVGIGTTSPQTKLHVNGETRTSDIQLDGGNIKVSIPTTTGGWARGLLYYSPGVYSTNEIGGIGVHGSSLTPTRIFLGFGDNPWNTVKGIQIKSNGFVGIGTTNPTSYFDITNGEYKTYFDGNSLNFKNTNRISYINKVDTGDLRFRMGVNYNTAMIIKSNLNIGIGTINPEQKLSLKGDFSIGTSDSNDNQWGEFVVKKINASVNYASLGFSQGTSTNNGNSLNALTIQRTGNIGIGTTTPSSKLHISSVSNESRTKPKDLIHLTATNSSVGYNGFGTSIVDFRRTYQNSTPHAINRISFIERGHSTSDQGGAITFSTKLLSSGNAAPVERMRVDYNGNVGIGTSKPGHNLDISNNSALRNVGVELDASHYTGTGTSHSFIQFKTPNFKTDNTLTNGAAEIGLSNANGALYITRKTNVGVNSNGIILDKNANVGIGTISTGGHKLAVEGSIGAREVKVETTSWPDYVFTNEYKLPSLQEVERHIKSKGHLKNIPSAKQVKANGIKLGEMNKKLLEKIEELTLYTIQQEKAIETQNKKIDKQEKKLKELKTLVQKLIKTKD